MENKRKGIDIKIIARLINYEVQEKYRNPWRTEILNKEGMAKENERRGRMERDEDL